MSHGTVIDERPSSSATSGANANTMIVSLSATWLKREMRLAVHEVRPDEHHGRARGRRQQDQPGDITIDLSGWQPGAEQMRDEQPAKQGHRERLDQPIDADRRRDATPMAVYLTERRQIDLQQHRHDHEPDQHGDRKIDLRHGGGAEGVEHLRHRLPEADADDDAERNPECQVALERADRRRFAWGDGGGFTH